MSDIIQLDTLHNAFDFVSNAERERKSIVSQAIDLLKEACSSFDYARLALHWENNPSKLLPYHNNFHQASVAVLADTIWRVIYKNERPEERAALIIAAMFHDYNHSGGAKPDTINVVTTLRDICPLVPPSVEHLVYEAILSTEFPFVRDPVSDVAKVLRDADILACTVCSQYTYYQQYVVGLRKEIELAKNTTISDEEFFTMQMNFLPNIKFFVASEPCDDLMFAYSNIISWNFEWLKDAKAETSEDKEN